MPVIAPRTLLAKPPADNFAAAMASMSSRRRCSARRRMRPANMIGSDAIDKAGEGVNEVEGLADLGCPSRRVTDAGSH